MPRHETAKESLGGRQKTQHAVPQLDEVPVNSERAVLFLNPV